MKFNTQVCTTREQSKRLLALGLSEETADCRWMAVTKDAKGNDIPEKQQSWFLRLSSNESAQCVGFSRTSFEPAWSLHRLLSLLPEEINCGVENGLGLYLGKENDVSYFGVLGYYTSENLYDAIILCIEDVIKEGYFNKEYLKEQLYKLKPNRTMEEMKGKINDIFSLYEE